MKTNIFVTTIIILVLALSLFSQTKKTTVTRKKKNAVGAKQTPTPVTPILIEDNAPPPPPPPPRMNSSAASSDKLLDVSIDKFGIKGLSVPSNMPAEPVNEEKTKNGDVTWSSYRYEWKTPVSGYSKPVLEVVVRTTLYNADFTKVIPDLKPDKATPEVLLLVDYLADLKIKEQPNSWIKEVKWLDLSGVTGEYLLADEPGSETRFMALWQTYRLLDGKAHTVSITVTGNLSEMPKAEKIINSFKLQTSK